MALDFDDWKDVASKTVRILHLIQLKCFEIAVICSQAMLTIDNLLVNELCNGARLFLT